MCESGPVRGCVCVWLGVCHSCIIPRWIKSCNLHGSRTGAVIKPSDADALISRSPMFPPINSLLWPSEYSHGRGIKEGGRRLGLEVGDWRLWLVAEATWEG